MYATKLIAARDPRGYRPLCIGELPTATATSLPARAVRWTPWVRNCCDVSPGEIVIADRNGLRTMEDHCGAAPHTMCVFEYIYFARPDSRHRGHLGA